ncbi:hypothetical protein [Ruegeria sp. MALMAid1280]|uniref:hypothetical protein n=1 Tax=Ruegeria sp. MALMAid1280 TaxID=3411634 RepID=UPI003BA26A67
MNLNWLIALSTGLAAAPALAQENPIQHDAEFYILQAQNGEQWAQDDAAVDEALAAFRDSNGGKPLNIVIVLIDDMGFGDMGIPEFNAVRSYATPNINVFSDQAMRMVRMYIEPSCTPTRVAQLKPWPTYRMTFRGCQKAFPDGEVFLNMSSTNPLLRLLDMVTEITFDWGIGRQHQEGAPLMDNMDRSDDRLPNKTHV